MGKALRNALAALLFAGGFLGFWVGLLWLACKRNDAWNCSTERYLDEIISNPEIYGPILMGFISFPLFVFLVSFIPDRQNLSTGIGVILVLVIALLIAGYLVSLIAGAPISI